MAQNRRARRAKEARHRALKAQPQKAPPPRLQRAQASPDQRAEQWRARLADAEEAEATYAESADRLALDLRTTTLRLAARERAHRTGSEVATAILDAQGEAAVLKVAYDDAQAVAAHHQRKIAALGRAIAKRDKANEDARRRIREHHEASEGALREATKRSAMRDAELARVARWESGDTDDIDRGWAKRRDALDQTIAEKRSVLASATYQLDRARTRRASIARRVAKLQPLAAQGGES